MFLFSSAEVKLSCLSERSSGAAAIPNGHFERSGGTWASPGSHSERSGNTRSGPKGQFLKCSCEFLVSRVLASSARMSRSVRGPKPEARRRL